MININEDKFANKSAEEIISDMLTQHKNNSKEALDHIQNILKDDGLTLSKDVKDNLQKAATILSDKGLKEGWFSKKPRPEKKEVIFTVYLPFKKEPVKFTCPPVASLDDPIINETIQKIRKRHPHSPIYIEGELGTKIIREDKENKKNTPVKSFIKDILSNDLTKNFAATALGGLTGISPIFTKSIANGVLDAAVSKKLDKSAKNKYKVDLYDESNKYSCYVGNLPIALTLVENTKQYKKADILFEDKIICSYSHDLKEWTISKTENVLKEDIYGNNDITKHAYVDFRKDTADIDERTKLILCHLNPNLIDKRKPKWCNTLLDTPKLAPIENSILGTKGEVLIVLDGIENDINQKNPDQTEVTIQEKIPYLQKGNGYLYRNGDLYVITVAQFKEILNDPKNAETREKFENKHDSAILNDEQASYFLELDSLAKKTIDARYPNWEQSHWDEYNLGMYDLSERAKIYQAWKDINRTNMYQQARELTPEEVNKQFGLPKLKEIIASKPLMAAFENTKANLPLDERDKLDNALLNLIANNDTVEDSDIKKIISYYGAKNQLNKIPSIKDKLYKIEHDLNDTDKEAFESELENLINTKYIDSKKYLPTIVNKVQEAIKDVNTLIQKYSSKTNSSVWNKEVTAVKGNNDKIKSLITTIKNEINVVEEYDHNVAKNLLANLRGKIKNWQEDNIVGDELINNLNNYLNEMHDWISNFKSEYTDLKNTRGNTSRYDKPGFDRNAADEAQKKFDQFLNTSRNNIKFKSEKDHDEWLDMVKHIENPKSKSETDPSYYGAITNKISRLVKHDPQAAKGYGNAFRKLLKDLEAKELSEKQIEVQLAKFLNKMKDETGEFGTITKALASAI